MRYVVCGYGYNGYSSLDEILKRGKYFNRLSDAAIEYDRLWDEDLQPDEGACIYDTFYEKFIVED